MLLHVLEDDRWCKDDQTGISLVEWWCDDDQTGMSLVERWCKDDETGLSLVEQWCVDARLDSLWWSDGVRILLVMYHLTLLIIQ